MSRRHKHSSNQNIGFPIAYIFLILVLIVLQWFRVSSSSSGTVGTTFSESNLVSNGGLFIIALFAIIICSCESQRYSGHKNYRRHCRYRC